MDIVITIIIVLFFMCTFNSLKMRDSIQSFVSDPLLLSVTKKIILVILKHWEIMKKSCVCVCIFLGVLFICNKFSMDFIYGPHKCFLDTTHTVSRFKSSTTWYCVTRCETVKNYLLFSFFNVADNNADLHYVKCLLDSNYIKIHVAKFLQFYQCLILNRFVSTQSSIKTSSVLWYTSHKFIFTTE